MSLPSFSTQGELFSTAGLSASLFASTDRYRLFARLVYPELAAARAELEKCYCVDNGRIAIEPVLMLGVSLLQELDGVPDRQAVEMLRYHAGWNFGLNRQLGEAGTDAWQLLEWLRQPAQKQRAAGTQAQLLKRIFGEQFEVSAGQARVLEKESVVTEGPAGLPPVPDAAVETGPVDPGTAPAPCLVPEGSASPEAEAGAQTEFSPEAMGGCPPIQPKGKGQLGSDRVQNPHDPEATYAVKGQGSQKKEHVGYKVQVAESVSEAVLEPGEPTRNFIVGMVTQSAHESDELGAEKMEQEQAAMGMAKPPVQYVDGAYVSGKKLAQAQAEGRELIGPAQPAPQKDGRFTTEDFQVNVEERSAVCPAGKTSTQCSRLEEEATGRVNFRFEFGMHCHDCPMRGQCLGKGQRHRTLLVGEHHTALQARRQEQQTEAFQQRMKHRNGIEGTQSELVRGHGMRRARYRGLANVKLQNYFLGAACNVKRWIRREAWKLTQAVLAAETASAAGQ